jgi:hypothetical protein
MQAVSYEFISGLAAEFGAVECCWRESERSFTGFVAEVWFAQLDFIQNPHSLNEAPRVLQDVARSFSRIAA